MYRLPENINKEELLSYLRPLYPNGLFPLAAGWQILIGMTLAAFLVTFLYYQSAPVRRRRRAYSVLKELSDSFSETSDISALSSGISILLKRISLVRFGNEKVADLKGQDWTSFLNETGAGLSDEGKRLLADQAFAPMCQDSSCREEGERLIFSAQRWMRQNL